MKLFPPQLLLCVLGVVLPGTAAAAPVIPGLAAKHALTEAEVGQLLLGELKCAACHGGPAGATPQRAAPDLDGVGGRADPAYLKRFLAAPEATHPGTTMPDLLSGLPAAERDRVAEALTYFLVTRSPKRFERGGTEAQEAAAGKAIFHSVGCVVCHAPRDAAAREMPRDGAVGLGHVAAKYGAASLADFLYQPTRVRPSGRMPDMKLTPIEAKAVASYLLGPSEVKPVAFQPDEKLAAAGKQHFERLNCAACHKLGDGANPKPAIALAAADLGRGCASGRPGAGPRYPLDDAQRKAIRTALAAGPGPATAKSQVALTLTAFNCVGCHTRGDAGGVAEEVDPYFTSSEKELGDDGRIPPPLTLVGAKLQTVALKKVLFDGVGVRPYMATRMPQYGEPNLHHLPDLFAKLDAVPPVEFRLPRPEGAGAKEREREKEMRVAGRELVGDKGLGCVACHPFNGKAAGKQGIDLLTTTERLRPSWYYHYMQDPAAFRPRIVMPTSWPNGVAMHKTILGGDTHRQLEAIWYYLSLGTSAATPSGVQNPETLLDVADAARTYRGRSTVAGFRGIAVGFREKLNYAFNAETGTLTGIWGGDFVRVNRGGQGSGNFSPAGRFAPLHPDVSFHALPDEKAAWPLRPVLTKEAPANPDPLYPKNLGYQFRGYYTDDASVPTFMYRSGAIDIEDRTALEVVGSKPRLVRTLAFDAPEPRTVWFRVMAGDVRAESETRFRTGVLRVTVPAGPALLRPTADAKASELLLRFDIPKGKSTRTLTYELLP